MISGAANVLSNPPLVIDVTFGNFPRLSCCFTDCILQSCLTCNNGFINMENNFVLFYFHTKSINLICINWMISHNRKTGRLGFDILIDTGKFHLIYLSIVFNRFSIKPNQPCDQIFSNTNDRYDLKNVSTNHP